MKEEERLKQEALLNQLREADKKNGSKDDQKLLAKRTYTYDYNGDIVFIRNLRTDGLPNPLINPPFTIK